MCRPQRHHHYHHVESSSAAGGDGDSSARTWSYVRPKNPHAQETQHVMVVFGPGRESWLYTLHETVQTMDLKYWYISEIIWGTNSCGHFFLSFHSTQQARQARESLLGLNDTLIVPMFEKEGMLRDEEMGQGDYAGMSEEEFRKVQKKKNRVPRLVVHYSDMVEETNVVQNDSATVVIAETECGIDNVCGIPGLALLKDFVTEEEEKALMDLVDGTPWERLARRRVQHYGRKFSYVTRTVDSNSDAMDIPVEMVKVMDGIRALPEVGELDQITVNEYAPGVGLSPHVDTHSAFGDTIASLSLCGGAAMIFRKDGEQRGLYLPPRSLLLMQKESRWAWEHYIPHRKSDMVEHGEIVPRTDRRVSLTFRSIRHGPCSCPCPEYCDSQLASIPPTRMGDELNHNNIENGHVNTVYNEIARHFSATRFAIWPEVRKFINSIPEHGVVADVGCGNGKYFGVRKNVYVTGSDRSSGLATVASARLRPNSMGVIECPKADVCIADGLRLPYRNGSCDAAISIAVIHHMSSVKRRVALLDEIGRILRKGGRALVTSWATEHDDMKKMDTWEKIDAPEVDDPPGYSSPHDFLVPWHLPLHRAEAAGTLQSSSTGQFNKEKNSVMYKRYYHLFAPGELEKLVEICTTNLQVVYCVYDRDNWCL